MLDRLYRKIRRRIYDDWLKILNREESPEKPRLRELLLDLGHPGGGSWHLEDSFLPFLQQTRGLHELRAAGVEQPAQVVPTQGSIRFSYDEQFDVMEIFFLPPTPSVTVQVEEDVFLHVVPFERKVAGMTIHRFLERHSDYILPFQGYFEPTTAEMKERLEKAGHYYKLVFRHHRPP